MLPYCLNAPQHKSGVWRWFLLLGVAGCLRQPAPTEAATNLSAWAFPGASGRVLRQPDVLGNRVLDYSGAGFRGGASPIPDVPVQITISPVPGDNGANIQNAINAVKALPLDAQGFRGAVLLAAGEYPISNSITINASGIVLRGAGNGPNGTILRATGSGQRTLVLISGSGSPSTVGGTTHNITDLYVPVGARSFNVDSTAGLAVGDRVFVRRIATTNWIHDLGMDLLCCPPGVNPWTPSSYNIDFDRVITRLEGSRVTLDAPITCAMDQYYGSGTIRKYAWSGRIQNCGVEDLRGVSDFDPAVTSTTGASSAYYADEDHAWTFIQFNSIEHAWARRVTSQYFGYSCVALQSGAKWVTVADCSSLDPVSIITGGRRYAFVMDDCQLCLVQNCYTRKDRHQFVTQSLTTGPNVFVDGLSDTAYSDAGPHHRWGTGALWDNVTVNGNSLNIQNRGNLGSGHGWAGANEVVWNSDADGGFVVQNPPTARNWLIGSIGPIKNGTVYVGPHDPGTYDSQGSNVFPQSLYHAQLQDRLAAPTLQIREYWLGDIDQFSPTSPTGDVVVVDAAWRGAVQAAAGTSAVNGFDLVTTNQWVPWTFAFSLASTDRLVGATLALAMRSAAGGATNPVLYLDALANSRSFASLGWRPVGTGTNTTVRLLDLGSELTLLADGKLNLAVADGVGLDWALLEIQVSPTLAGFTNRVLPVADAFVRGGLNAALNYGTNTTLDIKADSSADTRRQAYIRWHLPLTPAAVVHARVRLTPVSVGTNGLEQGVARAASDNWSETGITWNNQPGGGKRFASWIPAPNLPVEFVVTPQVQAALATDGRLSLELLSLKDVGAPGLASYASREDPDPARRPQLLLVTTNPIPFISSFEDLAIGMDAAVGPIPFTIGDALYPASALVVGAASSNPALVPQSGLVLGGSLSNRTLTVTPLSGQTGSALLTVTVTNPAGASVSSRFTLTVTNTGGTMEPASGSWASDASGRWSDPANWVGGMVATGANQTATFSLDVTAVRFVDNNSPRVLGHLTFGDADTLSPGQWVITNQPITLQVSNGAPLITVSEGEAAVAVSLAGTQGFSKQGEGRLLLPSASAFSGTVNINAGPLCAAHKNALGDARGRTVINNGATARLELTNNLVLAEPLTVACKGSALGNVPAVVNTGGTNTLAGGLTLTTGGSYWTFEAQAGRLIVTGSPTNSTTTNVRTIWLRGTAQGEWQSAIGDSAAALATAVRKDDAGTWTLAGANTYSGNTVISNGTLLVKGVIGGGTVSVAGGTLGGTGIIEAPVTVSPGASLSPGGSIGVLTISNSLTLAAGSTTVAEINAQTLSSDQVRGLTSVAYGGTLVVTNLAGTVVAGQSYQLFIAGASSGDFTSISPPSPGPGLAWYFDPNPGRLSAGFVAPPRILSFECDVETGFRMSGTGPAGQPYRVLAATNVALPMTAWTVLATGWFHGGSFTFTDPLAAGHVFRCYRVVSP